LSTAVEYFTETYAEGSVPYTGLPDWVLTSLPDSFQVPFNDSPITPKIVKGVLHHCSAKSAPGPDNITYFHLKNLPASHHFLATLFNKLLKSESSPPYWSTARIKLLYKQDATDHPKNFRPIALTSAVGKLFHKIISQRLEHYLISNNVIDTSVQKGFISSFPGIFEHIYSVSNILEKAISTKSPLMMTFIDLQNAFGSVPHQYIFDMLESVQVPSCYIGYIKSVYSHLSAIIKCHQWTTPPIPIRRGVFQGDTMSPIIFILTFNPLLKLAEDLNKGHGFFFQLSIPNSSNLPPVGAYVYIKWLEPGDELPGWYKAQVHEYNLDGSCKVVYDESSSNVTFETLLFEEVEWLPCYRCSSRFVPLSAEPKQIKPRWKTEPKVAMSLEHSTKAYADDATLISTSEEVHTKVLKEVDLKASDIGLKLKPSKCVSLLFNGTRFCSTGISLSGGTTKTILDGPTKFLGKLIGVSAHTTKVASGKAIFDKFSDLLQKVDKLPVRPEYQVWIYRNYVLSIIRFHLTVDSIGPSALTKMENLATKYLKRWLCLPRSATRVILNYPGVCCPSVSSISKQCKLSLLANISQSSDPLIQELALQVNLSSDLLQINISHQELLYQARAQLDGIPTARKLYTASKQLAVSRETTLCQEKLDTLSVQCKFGNSATLEADSKLWNRLLLGFHPGQLSFVLRASSDTLPTPLNLRRWHIQTGATCALCQSPRPTSHHVLNGCPVALQQGRYTYRHDAVLSCLMTELQACLPNVEIFADLEDKRASDSPPATIPPAILVSPYRPDIVVYNAELRTISLLELTCPFNSNADLSAARQRKESKLEYQQIVAELDRLGFVGKYFTIEIGCLGHYLKETINSMKLISHQSLSNSRASLDRAAAVAITSSQRIFLSRNNPTWTN